MPFQIIRNNIVRVKADAIVNTANPDPVVGSGTDRALYEAAGMEELLAERRKIGKIRPGFAVSTSAYHLPAKYIIHTVGPVWIDGNHQEIETLNSCYHNSLELAYELKCESIAFPLISSGNYHFPKDRALETALSAISTFLLGHDMEVILVVFDESSFQISRKLYRRIEQFIDSHEVQELNEKEYNSGPRTNYGSLVRGIASLEGGHTEACGKGLQQMLAGAGKTFQQRLFELIDESGMDDVTVYKRANVDRKVFSRIRGNKDYHPKKTTAVAFAIALQLNLNDTRDLLSKAGYALSDCSCFDLIITYFISNGSYNIYEINAVLFEYRQPILGAGGS